jgi:5'-nucleotidase / UDP-sugar diphosphatase
MYYSRQWKRTSFIIIFSLIVFSSLYCQPKTLTILHTNDMHASFAPHEANWIKIDPKPMVGGFLELGWMIDSIRKAKGEVLVLDGGDVMTGNPIAEIKYKEAFGGGLFEMMNSIGYDVWTFGNHDLDISQENLKKLTMIAKFPTLSANVVDSACKFPLNNKEYVILTKNGLKIGIVGLMLEGLFRETNTNNLIGLKVLPVAEKLQAVIDKIDPQTDVIIALTHEGVQEDSMLATQVHGLDVIIGAHSHTRLKTPKNVNGVYICQTGSYCENLGELDLTIENDAVTSAHGELFTLWARHEYVDNELHSLYSKFKDEVDKEYGAVIGTLKEDYKRSRSGESNIGHFLSDAIREGTNADIAFTNSSGIRKDLLAGDITKLDLFEVAPFRNYLTTFTLSGKEVRMLLQRYIQSLANGRTSLDYSGVQCTWKRENNSETIQSILVNGKDLNDEQRYTCATIDYVINQGERYIGIPLTDVKPSTVLLFDALVEKVKRDKTIQDKAGNHFQEIH